MGKTVQVDETIYTIVGVVQRDFEGLELETLDMWAPLANQPDGLAGVDAMKILARLAPDANGQLLDATFTAQYRHSHENDPDVEDSSAIITAPILSAQAPAKFINPVFPARNLHLLTRIAGIGIVVLFISIANVASLLLMRALKRRREIAVRIALGVSRTRLVAQLMTESLIVATIAGSVALVIAMLTGAFLRSALFVFVRWPSTIVDKRLALFAAAMAVVSGVLAGLAPAAFALRADVGSLLKSSSSLGQRSGSRIRAALLVTQASLCMVLLASAGMFVQSLRRAGEVDRGFDGTRAIEVSVAKTSANPEAELKDIAERVRALPNVEAVGRSAGPFGSAGISTKIGPTFRDTIGVSPRGPSLEFMEPDYFKAASIPVIAGRSFSHADNSAFVAILNASLARALWPKGDVLGRCVHVREPDSPCRVVIGVVQDVIWDVTAQAPMFRVYAPDAQAWIRPPSFIPNYLLVRVRAAASSADVATIRKATESITGKNGIVNVRTLSTIMEPMLQPWRLAMKLFLAMGILGLLAAATGVYGLVAYDVTQRSRELGVRIALGATAIHILQLVVRSGAQVVAIGIGTGVVAALIAGKIMSSLLYDTAPYDMEVLTVTSLTFIAVAILACVLPAMRAVKTDPMTALSAE